MIKVHVIEGQTVEISGLACLKPGIDKVIMNDAGLFAVDPDTGDTIEIFTTDQFEAMNEHIDADAEEFDIEFPLPEALTG